MMSWGGLPWAIGGILGACPLLLHLCLLPARGFSSFFPQEKEECEQKRLKDQGAIREQLQVRGP